MKNDLKTVDQLRDALTVIASRSKQLGVFAEDVLTISNIEAGKHIQQFEEVNLDEFVKGVSDEFQDSAKQKGIEFVTNLKASSAKVKISQPHMRSAIWNLLDNALKFTTGGGKIELATELNDKQALISVRDDGIGISAEEMPKLFTKFHRGTDILKYDYAGTGIGLYVTKMILNEHHGKVAAKSKHGQGSTFTISLPVVD